MSASAGGAAMTVEPVVWWSRRMAGLTRQTISRRSVVHLREAGAPQTLCGVYVDWTPTERLPDDRDCQRCARRFAGLSDEGQSPAAGRQVSE